ncbi:HXXXD-type acyl-transferase family protein [Striga hermonthica]|uniref:HXXXD-type acyl-transferase family protein n=1 Tax=Striga hermonthica TaxID=68872 RepID=A0A9N7NDV3_STRHE|nr:HXXXD-type acyl-transferase family protein [Striga hermonthica]
MKIEVLSKELIKPSVPTPTHLKDFKLSFIDERIPTSYMPLILYYKFGVDKDVIKQSEMCIRLKRSLSEALVRFYPLAGRMRGQASVECNDAGILYIEARAEGKNISDIVKSMDSRDLDRLVPFESNGCVSGAEEQLAVQVTLFTCGGLSIGICLSHRIADICTLDSFIKCWVALASSEARGHPISPIFNSSTLFPPRNTPDFRPNFRSPSVQPMRSAKPVMRRFVFTPKAINALKLLATEGSLADAKPTRVEVLTAFLWSRCLAAKQIIGGKPVRSVAYHPINLRGKISELTENSFGNIFQMTRAENEGETDWVRLVEKVRAAFKKIDSEYVRKLQGEKGFELAKENFMEISKLLLLGDVEIFRFSSYSRFGFYEADFGWGRPAWASSAGYLGTDTILLIDSLQCTGGIEAWVVMAKQDMERLQQDLEIQLLTSSFVS